MALKQAVRFAETHERSHIHVVHSMPGMPPLGHGLGTPDLMMAAITPGTVPGEILAAEMSRSMQSYVDQLDRYEADGAGATIGADGPFLLALLASLLRLVVGCGAFTFRVLKLAQRGHPMPWALQANAALVHHVTDMTIDEALVIPAQTPGDRLELTDDEGTPAELVLVEDGKVIGVLSRAWALGHSAILQRAPTVSEVARHDYVTVRHEAAIFEVLASMHAARASIAVVSSAQADASEPGAVLGIVTKAHLAEVFAEGMELFSD